MSVSAGPSLRRLAVLWLLLQSAAIVVLYLILVRTARGQQVDRAAILDVFEIGVISVLDELLTIEVILLLGALLAGIAVTLVRRHPRLCLLVLLVVVGANLTTQAMKNLLRRPFLSVEGSLRTPFILPEGQEFPSGLPSGHVTLAASVCVAVVVMAPRGFRVASSVAGTAVVLLTGVAVTQAVGGTSAGFLVVGLLILALGGLHHDQTSGIGSGWPSTTAYVGYVLALLGASGLMMIQASFGQFEERVESMAIGSAGAGR